MRPFTLIDAGRRFGLLTTTATADRSINNQPAYVCICDCGNTVSVIPHRLVSGHTVSCGCKRRLPINLQHGHARANAITPEFRAWRAMITRCTDKNCSQYHRYGGRGVRVCDEWMDFAKFLNDMGKRPEGTTLDRRDNNNGYHKDNCRWATPVQQANNRSTSRILSIDGEQMTLAEASLKFRVNYNAAKYRLNAGWPHEAVVGLVPYRKHEKRLEP